jgi:hypothetical protein
MPLNFIDHPTAETRLAPDYARYPEAQDLTDFLADAALTASAWRLNAAVLAGIDSFEQQCQRHFLAGRFIDNRLQNPYARTYDPPASPSLASDSWGAVLDLGSFGDMQRIDTVMYTAGSTPPQEYEQGTQYRPLPVNALAREKPVTSLEFLRLWWRPTPQMLWGALEITGLWGYGTRIPPAAWMAMLSAGALSLFSSQFRGAGVPVGIKSWTGPGGISQTYDATMLTARLKEWGDAVTAAAQQFGRWGFG